MLGHLKLFAGLTPARLPPSAPRPPGSLSHSGPKAEPSAASPHTEPARRGGAGLWGRDRLGTTRSRPAMTSENEAPQASSLPASPQTTPPRTPRAASAPLLNIQINPVLTAVIGRGRSNQAPPLWRGGAISRPLVWGRERRPGVPQCACAIPAHARDASASACCRSNTSPAPFCFYPVRNPPGLLVQWSGNMLIKGRGGRGGATQGVLPNQKAGKGRGVLPLALRLLWVLPWRFTSAAPWGGMAAALPSWCFRVGRGRGDAPRCLRACWGRWGRTRGSLSGRSRQSVPAWGVSRWRGVSAKPCAASAGVKPWRK